MLFEVLSQVLGFPPELGIMGYLFIGSALTILVMYMVTMMIEFIIGIFR